MRLPSVPVTVSVGEPVGVDRDELTVRTLEKEGLPLAGAKLHEAPEGKPDVQDRLTLWVDPPVSVAVMVLEPESP